ncbi:MAG: DUF368 domain-containing protein [Spirochaetaceae bacterium]|jgi:putative membrane protein|nr:DUF368 domain-containing protein [Spirochaetaceae bacterium]
MISALKLFAIGVVLGIANVIPGVSGGTLAVVFDVYDRLIDVVTPNVKKICSRWKFWLPLFAGAASGIVVFSKLVAFLLATHPAPAKSFFIGVILGSIPLIARRAKKPGATYMPISASVCAIAALIAMLFLAMLNPQGASADGAHDNPINAPYLFAAGVVSAAAMIIPGISGSLILLAIGAYATIVSAVSELSSRIATVQNISPAAIAATVKTPLLIVSPFAAGVVAGLLLGAALVRILLERAPRQTYGAILGLIVGSLLIVYPKDGWTNAATVIISIASLIFGAGLSLSFSRKETENE